ncbi:MAG: hypothetical protein CMF70_06725 [Magnetovibrio sp.]|nr:hypothetical protein [Magnetovibrio sp.]
MSPWVVLRALVDKQRDAVDALDGRTFFVADAGDVVDDAGPNSTTDPCLLLRRVLAAAAAATPQPGADERACHADLRRIVDLDTFAAHPHAALILAVFRCLDHEGQL